MRATYLRSCCRWRVCLVCGLRPVRVVALLSDVTLWREPAVDVCVRREYSDSRCAIWRRRSTTSPSPSAAAATSWSSPATRQRHVTTRVWGNLAIVAPVLLHVDAGPQPRVVSQTPPANPGTPSQIDAKTRSVDEVENNHLYNLV